MARGPSSAAIEIVKVFKVFALAMMSNYTMVRLFWTAEPGLEGVVGGHYKEAQCPFRHQYVMVNSFGPLVRLLWSFLRVPYEDLFLISLLAGMFAVLEQK